MRHKLSIDARYRALNIAIVKAREGAEERICRYCDDIKIPGQNSDYIRYNFTEVLNNLYLDLTCECIFRRIHLEPEKNRHPDRHINWLRKELNATIATEAHLLAAVTEAYKVTHERVIDVLKNQQELGPEFQKVLFDNLESLYEN